MDQEARNTVMQLSEMVDLIGLRTYIAKKTNYGKRPGPQAWTHTKGAMAIYAPSSDPESVIALFESVNVRSDIDAARWILKHDALVP